MSLGQARLVKVAEDFVELVVIESGLAPSTKQGDPEIGVPAVAACKRHGQTGFPAEVALRRSRDGGDGIVATRTERALRAKRQQVIQPLVSRSRQQYREEPREAARESECPRSSSHPHGNQTISFPFAHGARPGTLRGSGPRTRVSPGPNTGRHPLPKEVQCVCSRREWLGSQGCSAGFGGSNAELHYRDSAPEVLRITALRLKQWGETRRAEEELPGLVSRLIRSELFAAGFLRAPSDERIIEPGPDIAVNNPARATRHIPGGQSVWEVSTRADVQKKATEDLSRRGLPTGWQRETTSFVFVTTRSWPGAKEWAFQQQAKHPWRSITVLDATDLQSWIEESLGVQLWLVDRMGLEREGFQWLRAAVQDWSSADPPPGTALLRSSVDRYFTAWREWLRSPSRNPLTIIGESTGEALLFVQALIEHGASQAPRTPIEGLCVSTEEALRHLTGSPPSDVVVIPTNESVRELAVAHSSVLRVVLPVTGQPRVMNPLKVSPAGNTAVRDFLVGAGGDSGRALTVGSAESPHGCVTSRGSRTAQQ